jgi:cytochrome b561
LHSARRLFLERAAYKTFREQVQEARRLGVKVAFHKQLKKLMQIWRSLHVVLAVVLLGLIATHVLVSVRVGFRWIWK